MPYDIRSLIQQKRPSHVTLSFPLYIVGVVWALCYFYVKYNALLHESAFTRDGSQEKLAVSFGRFC